MSEVITRDEYMKNSENLHDHYFRQFVTRNILMLVKSRIGVERIKASTDPYMNDIPLKEWDNLHALIKTSSYYIRKQAGEDNSLGTTVCIAKAAARIIKEEST